MLSELPNLATTALATTHPSLLTQSTKYIMYNRMVCTSEKTFIHIKSNMWNNWISYSKKQGNE